MDLKRCRKEAPYLISHHCGNLHHSFIGRVAESFFPALTSEQLCTHNPEWSLTLHQTYLRTISPPSPSPSLPPSPPPSPALDNYSADEDVAAYFNHEDTFSADEDAAASNLFFDPEEWI